LRDDRKLLQQTGFVFDGLYALLSKESQGKTENQSTTKKRRTTK